MDGQLLTDSAWCEAQSFLSALLPKNWICLQEENGFNFLMLSRNEERITQRRLFVTVSGNVQIFVHCKPLQLSTGNNIINKVENKVGLSVNTIKKYVDRCVSMVNEIRKYEICAGSDFDEYEYLWEIDGNGSVDRNPYNECRYAKTYRSHKCELLLNPKKWRCKNCHRTSESLKKKHVTHSKEELHPNTPNVHMITEEKLEKLKNQKKCLENSRRKMDRLQEKICSSINEKGVSLDSDMASSLEEVLKESKLSPVQELFLQQQLKAATVKGKSGMRWHPTIIRFALLLKSQGSLDSVRESGIISLPGDRILFDYSHVLPQSEGLHKERIDRILDKVKTYPENYQKFHNLLFDEMHVSHKIVYQKATGEMIGYVRLSEVEKEMKNLEDVVKENLTGNPIDPTPDKATKILAFMVRGIANSVKEVVASFTTGDKMTKSDLFDRVWLVIDALELSGIKIIACVCDGSAQNRAFIDMHTPVTVLSSGVVFDTINTASPDGRILYFISDPPHLLKTIRNCFAKSGKTKKHKRLMVKDGEEIVWSTIIRLFNEDKNDNLRRSHKLNAQNVFLNSYTAMKVNLAAQVMSRTVAMDILLRKWPNTSSVVKFIIMVNDFFDMLNGNSTTDAKRAANENLAAYESLQDPRIYDEKAPDGTIIKRSKLGQFWDYIEEWKNEVNGLKCSEKEKKKKMLARQTIDGIEMAINGFIGAVNYLLSIGTKFINARVFCQDPLEQYFGKQRQAGGGSRNPNVERYFQNDNKIALHRDMNVRRRSGNVAADNKHWEVDDAPLPKKRKTQ